MHITQYSLCSWGKSDVCTPDELSVKLEDNFQTKHSTLSVADVKTSN